MKTLVSGKINLVNVLKSQVLKMAIEDLSDQHGSQPCRRRRRAGGSLTEAHHFTFPAVPVLADSFRESRIPTPIEAQVSGEARESTRRNARANAITGLLRRQDTFSQCPFKPSSPRTSAWLSLKDELAPQRTLGVSFMNLEYYTTRELPCECLALVAQPFPDCPCCYGTGTSEQDVIVDVQYQYYPPSRGSRDRWGCPLEPDEPAFVEILDTSIELTVSETEDCEEKCLIDAELRIEDARTCDRE